MDNSQLLTVAQVAHRLNIGKSKAYEMMRGELRYGVLRFDGIVRLDANYLERWLKDRIGHDDPPIPGRPRLRRY